MKIILQGNIIDTDYIYRIGEVLHGYESDNASGFRLGTDDGNKDYYLYKRFYVYFYNQQEPLAIDCSEIEPTKNTNELWLNTDKRKKVGLELEGKLTKVRSSLVEIWNKTNLNLPVLEIE